MSFIHTMRKVEDGKELIKVTVSYNDIVYSLDVIKANGRTTVHYKGIQFVPCDGRYAIKCYGADSTDMLKGLMLLGLIKNKGVIL